VVPQWSWCPQWSCPQWSRLSGPGDDTSRRPSHADRVKTLKKHAFREKFSRLPRSQRAARKIRQLFKASLDLATATSELYCGLDAYAPLLNRKRPCNFRNLPDNCQIE